MLKLHRYLDNDSGECKHSEMLQKCSLGAADAAASVPYEG